MAEKKSFKQAFSSQALEEFLKSRQADFLIFSWAAAEAVVWYVIPEFLLFLIIFLRIPNKKRLLIYDFLGTMFGTAVGFFVVKSFSFNHENLPFLTQSMIDQVVVWYQQLGIWGLSFQPFSGVPYKVFVMEAVGAGLPFVQFVFFGVVVRLFRYYIFFALLDGLYGFFHKVVYKNYWRLFFLACFVFSVLLNAVYASYL